MVWLMAVGGLAVLISGLITHIELMHAHHLSHGLDEPEHERRLWVGLGLIALVPVILLFQRILSEQAKCPLCMTPPLVHRDCQRSRNARRLFGSYRLRIACAVLLRGKFTCQYCGEPTRCVIRDGISRRTGRMR